MYIALPSLSIQVPCTRTLNPQTEMWRLSVSSCFSLALSGVILTVINEDQLCCPNKTFLKRQIIYDRKQWICTVFIWRKNTFIVV